MSTTAELAIELELSTRLEALHQLLYTRGGIRPVNAAVEELSKLLLLRIASHRYPDLLVSGSHRLSDLVNPNFAAAASDTSMWKEAFNHVVRMDDLRGTMPDGNTQPVWPTDEPLRITRSDVLAEALNILSSIDIASRMASSLDPLGTAFDTFLHGKYDHAGGLGTYLTPASVADAMAEIGWALASSPSAGLAGDPCCGTGRFLSALASRAGREFSGASLQKWLSSNIVGADQSAASVAMARVNLLSYGAHHPRIFTVEDSVIEPSLDQLRGQFRLLLTNPPFGDGKYDNANGIARTDRILGSTSRRNKIDPSVAFVARCVDLLAPDGVAGIILPDGVLNSPRLRQVILDRKYAAGPIALEGVVSLPTATFAPSGTVAKTSVLFLRRAKSKRSTVFTARAIHVGHVMKSGVAVADPGGDDLPNISSTIVDLVIGDLRKSMSPLVTSRSLADIDTLDASDIDTGASDARAELLAADGRPFADILSVAPARRIALTPSLPFVSVLHIDDLGSIKWHEAEVNLPITPGKLAHSGDLIISLLNPAKFRAAVIPARYSEVQVSSEFGVFRSTIDPYAAFALVQHRLVRAQLASMGKGTSSSRRRIDSNDLLRVICPSFTTDWVVSTSNNLRSVFARLDHSASELFEVITRH